MGPHGYYGRYDTRPQQAGHLRVGKDAVVHEPLQCSLRGVQVVEICCSDRLQEVVRGVLSVPRGGYMSVWTLMTGLEIANL